MNIYKSINRWVSLFLTVVFLVTATNIPAADAVSASDSKFGINQPIAQDSDASFEAEENAWIEQQLLKALKNEQNIKMLNELHPDERPIPEAVDRELVEKVKRKKERELGRTLDKLNEELAGLNIANISKEYDIPEARIQEQLDQGLTLNEVAAALRVAETEKMDLTAALKQAAKVFQNKSGTAESQITSDLPEVDLTKANVFQTMLPPPPEEPNLEMLKVKLDEAPYKVDLDTENVSTVSGALSITEEDFTLPGRNGHAFTLKRQYDSGSSQLYDTDVDYHSVDYYDYYARINTHAVFMGKWFNLSYRYHIIKNKYECVSGAYILTVDDYWESTINQSFSSESARTQFINGLSSYSESHDNSLCAAYDRKYITKRFLSYTTSTEDYLAHSASDYKYYGPYTSLYEAQNVANQYSAGQLLESGPYGAGTYTVTVTGTSVLSDYVGTGGYYTNRLVDAADDKRFPIGKGWTWNIPYLKHNNGTYVHLADGGTYKVENGYLKGYPWKDLTLTTDNTVSVGGATSTHVLKSITGNKQYFDADGRVIQISDAYNNHTQFKYATVSPYGKVLTEIVDAIGNKITISYSTTQVTLTMGDRQVVYKKVTQNNKELLSQVIDPMQRVTTYSYHIKSAKFNLTGVTPITENPYALLTKTTHPTGAETVYEYENVPVDRYTSANSVNEAYRIASRKEVMTYIPPGSSSPTTTDVNYTSFVYPTDMGSSFNVDMNFTTKVLKGQLESVYSYKKDFIDDQTAPMLYLTKLEDSDLITKKITENTYDEVRRIPSPISTTLYYKTVHAESARITNATTFDDYGNVLSTTDTFNKVTTFQYDPVTHLRISEKWPTGNGVFLYVAIQRNIQGDVTSYELKSSAAATDYLSKTTYTYDGHGNILTKTVHDTNRTAVIAYEYDPIYDSAYLTKLTESYKDVDAAQQTASTSATYQKLTGNMLSFTDARGNTTSYEHDKLDRIKLITNPDLSTFQIQYNDIGNQLTTTSETTAQTRTTWDPIGRVIELAVLENGVFKAKTKSGYDNQSRKIWDEDPSGYRVAYTNDAWGRVTQTTNPDNSFSVNTYDDINNVLIETDEENNQVQKWYDKLGRIVIEKERNNGVFVTKQTTSYDDGGNVISEQNALNAVTRYSYDLLGQLTGVLTAKNELFQYGYDRLGNQTSIQYPGGGTISKKYDEVGRLIQYTDESTKTKKMYYDKTGNLSKLIDRKGQTIDYAYDSKNRLLSRSSSGSSISYTYYPDGKRKTMTDQTGITRYTYYPHNGLLKEKVFPDGNTIEYRYDSRGNKILVIGPFEFTARYTSYSYDEVNRIDSVYTEHGLTASYEYFKNDRYKKTQLGMGTQMHYTYEDFNLKTLRHTDSSGENAFNEYSYEYDLNGNVTGITENGYSDIFTYDPLGRVETSSQFIGTTGPFTNQNSGQFGALFFNETYGYDARGNRTSLESDFTPNLEAWAYTYDVWNRLTSATDEYNATVTYTYNGDDQLYERTENGFTTRYYWDDSNIIGEAFVNGANVSPIASYIYGYGLLERIASSSNRALYLMNGHQDVVGMVGPYGGFLNQYDYDIWGKQLGWFQSIPNPFGYSSEYLDSTTNLLFLGSRWYDANTARFLQEDTFEGELKNPLSLNLYTYAHNDPIAYSDPSGHFVFLVPVVLFVAKAVVKTAVDTAIDYAASKATGQSFDLGKSLASNGVTNLIPGVGEAKTASKIVKTVSSVSKGTGNVKGGAYSKVPKNGGENHHTPANSASPYSKNKGPSVNMEKADHRLTASWGSSKEAKAYRAEQGKLINQGKFKEAQQMDWIDIRSKFGNKYDKGINQAQKYTDQLLSSKKR